MIKTIGPAFGAELSAAGLSGLALSWGADGAIEFGASVTEAQRAAVRAVYAAHDPVAADQRAKLLAQLAAIDAAAGMNRGLREFMLINLQGWQALAGAVPAIAPLVAAVADNKGLQKVAEAEAQAAALRAELGAL